MRTDQRKTHSQSSTARPKKANGIQITHELLTQRSAYALSLGYKKQKWVMFCEVLLEKGFTLSLYEAQRTVSKYVTVYENGKTFKVRFSDHKPIKQREAAGDCDFFVGHTNFSVTTWSQAVFATMEFFGRI